MLESFTLRHCEERPKGATRQSRRVERFFVVCFNRGHIELLSRDDISCILVLMINQVGEGGLGENVGGLFGSEAE